jgi:hypothetical protein
VAGVPPTISSEVHQPSSTTRSAIHADHPHQPAQLRSAGTPRAPRARTVPLHFSQRGTSDDADQPGLPGADAARAAARPDDAAARPAARRTISRPSAEVAAVGRPAGGLPRRHRRRRFRRSARCDDHPAVPVLAGGAGHRAGRGRRAGRRRGRGRGAGPAGRGGGAGPDRAADRGDQPARRGARPAGAGSHRAGERPAGGGAGGRQQPQQHRHRQLVVFFRVRLLRRGQRVGGRAGSAGLGRRLLRQLLRGARRRRRPRPRRRPRLRPAPRPRR